MGIIDIIGVSIIAALIISVFKNLKQKKHNK